MNPNAHTEVAQFLRSLSDAERERFLAFAENESSPYALWLYASAVGWESGFAPLATWQGALFPRLDTMAKLRQEALSIEADLRRLRDTDDVMFKNAGDRERTIASLTKELRYHFTALQNAQLGVDRRGLMTAGADRLLQTLEGVFASNEDVLEAIREAFVQVAEGISTED